ncbi:MAG: radical SAM protein [Candidatus Omnitrophica bacterium]|nr:radical SAM protein [Candidatus Omnitrophota bacterium]
MSIEILERPEISEEAISFVSEECIQTGFSLCTSCKKVIPAKIVMREGYTYLVKNCIYENKDTEALIGKGWGKSELRKKLSLNWPFVKPNFGQVGIKEEDIINLKYVNYILLSLTKKCNSHCSICFNRDTEEYGELSLSYIKKILAKFKNRRVILFGGEPTVRKDLDEIIRIINQSGNTPILFTNGLKLSQLSYCRELKEAGLESVCLSFDGFAPHIYRLMRGVSEKEYHFKLAALENLKKIDMDVILQMTVVKGINEDQIKQIIDFIARNPFICAYWIRPLYLRGGENLMGFDKTNLLSLDEIKILVCQALGISPSIFELWDEVKAEFVSWIVKNLPFAKLSVIEPDTLYLMREGNTLKPLFNEEDLNEIKTILKNNSWQRLLNYRYISWVFDIIRTGFDFSRLEKKFRKKGLVRINLRTLAPYPNFILSNQLTITQIDYFSENFIVAYYGQ